MALVTRATRSIILVALVLLVASSSAHAQTNGNLPACPTPSTKAAFNGPVDNPDSIVIGGYNGNNGYFNSQILRGLMQVPQCASMDYYYRINEPPTDVIARGITSSATPSVFPATPQGTNVQLNVMAAGRPGPFAIASFGPCLPNAANTACAEHLIYSQIAVRRGSDDGEFTGRFEVVDSSGDSPVQFTRVGDCENPESHYGPSSTSYYFGAPCTYNVRYIGHSPEQDLPMQVLFGIIWIDYDANPPQPEAEQIAANTVISMVINEPGATVPTDPGGGAGAVGLGTGTGGGGSKPPGAVAAVFKSASNGVVTMTLNAPSAGALSVDLLAKRKVIAAAKKTVLVRRYKRKVAKAGPVKLKLKLKGKAKKALKRKGKLKVTVRTSFKPARGGKPSSARKTVKFKLKR